MFYNTSVKGVFFMKKFLSLMMILLLTAGCSALEPQVQTPTENSQVEEKTPEQIAAEKKAAEDEKNRKYEERKRKDEERARRQAEIEESKVRDLDTAPTKISLMPSIGTTRKEFYSAFRETARNTNDNIRFNNDTFLVTFDETNQRAYDIIIQPLRENNYLAGVNLNDFLPADTEIIADKTRADNMVIYGEVECHSVLLASVFPRCNGNFFYAFNYDRQSGKFLGGSIRIIDF